MIQNATVCVPDQVATPALCTDDTALASALCAVETVAHGVLCEPMSSDFTWEEFTGDSWETFTGAWETYF